MVKTPQAQAKEAANTIGRARIILETSGWIKGALKHSSGYCLLGAIQQANGKGEIRAIEIVRKLLPAWAGDIPHYNDSTTTTKNDVITLLLAAENIAKELAE